MLQCEISVPERPVTSIFNIAQWSWIRWKEAPVEVEDFCQNTQRIETSWNQADRGKTLAPQS
jgi:hypothetical protein